MRFKIKYPKYSTSLIVKVMKKLKEVKKIDGDASTNTVLYGDSLAPLYLPEDAPPFCNYPPSTPQSPLTSIPTPIGYTLSPPPSLPIQSPPESVPGPDPPGSVPSPFAYIPSPPGPSLNPPYYEPSPPSSVPNPPSYIPTPSGSVLSPPIFQPPVVFPPPTTPPPPNRGPSTALWCVAKPSVPDPIIQEAMNYACGSGAKCDSIQPSGSCFEPNSLLAHASYAFNDYWQRTKVAGGTCSFGGTAMLVTVDPSTYVFPNLYSDVS